MKCSPGKAMLKCTRLPVSVWNNTTLLSAPFDCHCPAALHMSSHAISMSLRQPNLAFAFWFAVVLQQCLNHAIYKIGITHRDTNSDSITKKSLNKDFPFSMKQATSYKYHLIHFIHSVLAFAKSAAPWSPEPCPEINSFKKCQEMKWFRQRHHLHVYYK